MFAFWKWHKSIRFNRTFNKINWWKKIIKV
jgi:signal peptidase I